MKTTSLLPAIVSTLALTISAAEAREPRGERPKVPTENLLTSSALQPATSLESASLSPRLTNEAWRKTFPIKEPPTRR